MAGSGSGKGGLLLLLLKEVACAMVYDSQVCEL